MNKYKMTVWHEYKDNTEIFYFNSLKLIKCLAKRLHRGLGYNRLRIDYLGSENYSRFKPLDCEYYLIRNNRLYYIDLMK